MRVTESALLLQPQQEAWTGLIEFRPAPMILQDGDESRVGDALPSKQSPRS